MEEALDLSSDGILNGWINILMSLKWFNNYPEETIILVTEIKLNLKINHNRLPTAIFADPQGTPNNFKSPHFTLSGLSQNTFISHDIFPMFPASGYPNLILPKMFCSPKLCIHFLFRTMANKCTQLFHKLSHRYMFRHYRCHPQTACNQYLAQLHQYFKCSCR